MRVARARIWRSAPELGRRGGGVRNRCATTAAVPRASESRQMIERSCFIELQGRFIRWLGFRSGLRALEQRFERCLRSGIRLRISKQPRGRVVHQLNAVELERELLGREVAGFEVPLFHADA